MIITDFRKKDLIGKIHTLGFLKGVFTWLMDIIARRTGNDKWEKPVHKIYMDFLQNKYWDTGLYKTNAIDELDFGVLEKSDKTNVWIFWYQGWDAAPQIVRDCRVTTEKYLDLEKFNVHYLTKDDYTSFVKFPEWIMKKVELGNITLTEFSNLLREALLYQFGGIWMDATIYLTEPLDDKMMDYTYYTIKRLPEHPMHCISRHQWSTFFLTANQSKTEFYQKLLTLQIEYWRKENSLFDYLTLDYLMALILRNNPDMAKEWEMIPRNNLDSLFLDYSLNNRYDSDKWKEVQKGTEMFKVTYKLQFSDDSDTNYNKIVNNRNINNHIQ